MAENVTAKATAQGEYRQLVDCLRSRLDDLAIAAVLYDRESRECSSVLASDWAAAISTSSEHYQECRTRVAIGARRLREAVCCFAWAIELDFYESEIIAQLSQDSEILICVFGERAACSDLCAGTILQWQNFSSDASIEARPLPSAAEIDAIIVHGNKLFALLNRGEEANE